MKYLSKYLNFSPKQSIRRNNVKNAIYMKYFLSLLVGLIVTRPAALVPVEWINTNANKVENKIFE